MADLSLTDAPVHTVPFPVEAGWIDYNGHMNVAYYVLAFDRALDQVLDALGIGEARSRSHRTGPFTLEAHIHYLREVGAGDPLAFTFQLLAHDLKKMHYFIEMRHAEENYLAATTEQISIYVDLSARRSMAYPPAALARISAMQSAHDALERPAKAGGVMRLKRR